MVVQLKPHQREAMEKLANGKILYGGTGVGKSITAMAYFFTKVCGGEIGDWSSVRTPKDIYVITTAKKRDGLDWEDEAHHFGIGKERDASIGGIKLTVDSWNNIGKYTGVHGAFFIFDEQRLVGSGSWVKAFKHIAKSNDWILLTATPGDTWLDYAPVFIANGYYKNITEFKRRHVVYNTFTKFPKVDRYLETGTLVRLRNSLLVHMPYERHTTRHSTDIKVSFDEEMFKRVVENRWHVYDMRPIRDVAEMFSVMRKVVNSDSSRLTAVMKLMETHPRLIVFYNFDYELENLRRLKSLTMPSSGREQTHNTQKDEPWMKTQFDTSLETRFSDGSSNETGKSSSKKVRARSTTSDERRGLGHPSTTSKGSTSIATKSSFSPRSRPSIELYTTTSESEWDYLLSPEGMRANGQEPSRSYVRNSRQSSNSRACSSKSFSTSTLMSADGLRSESHTPNDGLKSATLMRQPGNTSVSTERSLHSESGLLDVEIAEWNGHKHEPIPQTERWLYLVQYAAGAEGWNCVETDAMVFYSPTYSYKHDHQAHGRIDRLNTPYTDLYYYRLLSDSMIDKAIMRALRQKRSFNESSLRLFDDKKQGWNWSSELQ